MKMLKKINLILIVLLIQSLVMGNAAVAADSFDALAPSLQIEGEKLQQSFSTVRQIIEDAVAEDSAAKSTNRKVSRSRFPKLRRFVRTIRSIGASALMVLNGLDMERFNAAYPQDNMTPDKLELFARKGFDEHQFNSVVFFDIDLMGLTNKYISKQNVNIMLDVLEEGLRGTITALGVENAVSFRRGGDEFVLTVSTKSEYSVQIAEKIKEYVEKTRFAVCSLGTKRADSGFIDDVMPIVQEKEGNMGYVGRHNVLIVPCPEGNSGLMALREFINDVNEKVAQKGTGTVPIEKVYSWLDEPSVQNEVAFTLSVGIGEGDTFDQAHNLAASRKDIAKQAYFKKTGISPVIANGKFERDDSGESIAIGTQAVEMVEDYQTLENQARAQEKAGNNSGLVPFWAPSVRYFSSQKALRLAVSHMQENDPARFKHSLAFSMQMLAYGAEDESVQKFIDEYNNDPAKVLDNRIETRDFKVVNEVFGYVAGDEAIALFRVAAMDKFSILFKYFDLLLERGPPAGPTGFLVPKAGQKNIPLTDEQVARMFEEYVEAVRVEFNLRSKVKAGHARVIWDRFEHSEEYVGFVIERLYWKSMQNLYRTRVVAEYIEPVVDQGALVLAYDESIEDQWLDLEERLAWQAVASLRSLKNVWERNIVRDISGEEVIEPADVLRNQLNEKNLEVVRIKKNAKAVFRYTDPQTGEILMLHVPLNRNAEWIASINLIKNHMGGLFTDFTKVVSPSRNPLRCYINGKLVNLPVVIVERYAKPLVECRLTKRVLDSYDVTGGRLKELVDSGDMDGAKKIIDKYFERIVNCWERGIICTDEMLFNAGEQDGNVVGIDPENYLPERPNDFHRMMMFEANRDGDVSLLRQVDRTGVLGKYYSRKAKEIFVVERIDPAKGGAWNIASNAEKQQAVDEVKGPAYKQAMEAQLLGQVKYTPMGIGELLEQAI
ncbi:MAG: hypothetical protein ABII88_07495 [Candidatus Omnitrophota bacterium]